MKIQVWKVLQSQIQIVALESQIIGIPGLNDTINQLNSEIEDYTTRIESLESEITSLNSQIEDIDQDEIELNSLLSEKIELINDLQILLSEKIELINELQSMVAFQDALICDLGGYGVLDDDQDGVINCQDQQKNTKTKLKKI